jgi:Ca2+-binding RTX toxin-like protein
MAIYGTNGNDVLQNYSNFSDIIIWGRAGDDLLTGNQFRDYIFGEADDDELRGREGNDILNGGTGNDILNGGTGADIMKGDIGNDVYLVDNLADLAVELYGEGTDTVKSSVSFSLANKYIENIILTGSSNINATGNSYDNRLTGNAGLNILKGGFGDDIYVVQDQDDVVVEKAGQGTDTIQTASSYLLYQDHVENLTLTGSGDTYAIGNPNDNVIRGNSGDNELYGGVGDDTYYVQDKDDHVHESSVAGYDKVLSTVSFKLSNNVEYLKLTGSADIDGFGNTGNNTLIGNSGDNKLWGGTGNDTYYVQGNEDRAYEPQNGGHDTVFSDGSYSLQGQYAEDLVLENDQGWHLGTGNDLENIIVGADGGNTLSGEGGDDLLIGGDGSDAFQGGLGLDTMFGGGGADTFVIVFAAQSGASTATRDVITDFTAGTDEIDFHLIGDGQGIDLTFLAKKSAAFTGKAGDIRWFQQDKPGTGDDRTIVSGDIDGDKVADFQIGLTGLHTLTAGDFHL